MLTAADSELFAVLSQLAPALVSPVKVEEGWDRLRVRRVQKWSRTDQSACGSGKSGKPALFSKSSFLEQNRVTAATVQRYTVALEEYINFAKLPVGQGGQLRLSHLTPATPSAGRGFGLDLSILGANPRRE